MPRRRRIAPNPACRSGRCRASMSTWPTNIVVTRKSVTRRAVVRSPWLTSATPVTAVAARMPLSTVPVRRVTRTSAHSTSVNRCWITAASSAQRRTTNAWPRLARRSSRAAMPSSKAAAWSVQAISSSTLRREISGRMRRATHSAAAADAGKSTKAGHQVNPATTHSGPAETSVRMPCQTCHRSKPPTSCVSSSMRSRISPTACSDNSGRGCASKLPSSRRCFIVSRKRAASAPSTIGGRRTARGTSSNGWRSSRRRRRRR
jgi:hypothetical protein